SPGLAFGSDSDTGIYRISNNFIGFAASGARRFAMGSTALQGDGSTGGIQIRSAPGSASTPDYSFVDDTNTGMYRPGADQLGFSTGGTLRRSISSSDETFTLQQRGPNGSAAAP